MQKALVICGPTASGKSDLADLAADYLSGVYGEHVPVLVVDSMQVYREIGAITNQKRRRPAELTGVVPITDEWTVARHRQAVDQITEELDIPFVLDAGTGMYLNATIFDIEIAPKVSDELRDLAAAASAGARNPRRAARETELRLAGSEKSGSIWSGDLRYDLEFFYLRPTREELDAAIERRSSKISREGTGEAARLAESFPNGLPNPSVRDAIGVKELVAYVRGELSLEEAERSIRARTRRLSRRQMRWFDKLARTVEGRASTSIVGSRDPQSALTGVLGRLQAY